MSLLLKDPDAVLDYSIDWGAEYLGEDLLAEANGRSLPTSPMAWPRGQSFRCHDHDVKAAAGCLDDCIAWSIRS